MVKCKYPSTRCVWKPLVHRRLPSTTPSPALRSPAGLQCPAVTQKTVRRSIDASIPSSDRWTDDPPYPPREREKREEGIEHCSTPEHLRARLFLTSLLQSSDGVFTNTGKNRGTSSSRSVGSTTNRKPFSVITHKRAIYAVSFEFSPA
ncbi:hypothetical protein CDAR_98691 [Caerostris darwini]|uniref:Uncharacterized protein n=1 Tax=Caerostris darwini TaxID=1538125 RepID=A0AAV4Q1I3_9ARAC|nr:hypothetical protein CDAR_98691 [Caerostris darwini]